jgi:hypothetical protein
MRSYEQNTDIVEFSYLLKIEPEFFALEFIDPHARARWVRK